MISEIALFKYIGESIWVGGYGSVLSVPDIPWTRYAHYVVMQLVLPDPSGSRRRTGSGNTGEEQRGKPGKAITNENIARPMD